MSFTSLNLPPTLLRAVDALGFTTPTPIQRDAIPPARAGRDVLACAMTGSGKTAAFLLPIIERLMDKPRGVTRALVIAPTRELAAQIEADLRDLARFTPVRGATVFGGVGMGPQETAFRRGVDVIVATPGRLLDHMQHPYVRLNGLEVLVLDEADRMLDMGFLPDIRRILGRLPRERQTLLFSATMPAAHRRAGARVPAQSAAHQSGAQGRAGDRHHPCRLPGGPGAEERPAGRPPASGRHAQRARLHPHQASV